MINNEILMAHWLNKELIINEITKHFKNPNLPNQTFFKTQLFNRIWDLIFNKRGNIDNEIINQYLSEFIFYHYNETYVSKEEFDLGLDKFKKYLIFNFINRQDLNDYQIKFNDDYIYTWNKIIIKEI